jgi:predicted GH43/DUF377 family glycosyl hydrolase
MKHRMNNLDQRRSTAAIGLSAGIGAVALIALVLSLQSTAVAAPSQTTWYVHPNGSDGNPGSLLLPFATIQYAIGVASDGDTILVASGTYTENLVITETLTLRGGYTMSGTAWLPSTGETIVDGSGSQTVVGDWDRGVYAPAVITDDGVFKMWYTGVDLYSTSRVGYATSTNGITWTRLALPVLGPGNPSDWDEARVGQVSVLKNGPLYQMWFVGWDDDAIGQVGYATSTNGVDWTKYAGNPVLTVDAGAWDEMEVGGPRVVFDGSTYHLWYHGFAGSCCDSVGYATSPDGINWTKHPNNPVFSPGPSGDWDDGVIYATDVLTNGGQLHMWYTGVRAGWISHGIGYVTWPAVVKTDDLHHMWYRGSGNAGVALGYATSSDGISWTKSAGNPVFSPGTPGQWGDPVVRFETGSDGSVLEEFTITGGNVGQDGGGITINGASPIVRSCVIRDNTAQGQQGWGGGGILIGGGASPVISNTIVISNSDSGGAGGVRVGFASFTMINSLVVGNSGSPAIHGNSASMTLTNVTVAGNGPDGGCWLNDSHATILNSIVWEEKGLDIGVDGSGAYTITYSDVEDGVLPGAGNIDADPLFVDAANDDYHLKPGSPCIDAGTQAGAPAADIEGTARDDNPDMGAYEWTGFRIFLPLVLRDS